MCVMCKGGTREQVRQNLYAQICALGFALVPVGRAWNNKGWAYTIGLIDSRDHPELVVAGVQLGEAVTVLDRLAKAVLDGIRYDTCDTATANADIGFGEVQALHIRRGLMDGWIDYYGAAGRRDLDLRALQVVLPDGMRCYEHQRTQPRLDGNRHVSFDGLNRAARRGHPRPPRG
jgi:Domain of unknown function (DUF4262)